MPEPSSDSDTRITLDLLSVVDADGKRSQRSLSHELGIALGLTNAYLRRCIHRGWIKASQAPPNRYAYYLTPKGFSEKSRLTARYLKTSFRFYRRARDEMDAILEDCIARGQSRIVLAGRSDIAEITLLCAMQFPVEIVAIVDGSNRPSFMGVPIVRNLGSAPPFDAVILTDMAAPQQTHDDLAGRIVHDRLHTPKMLRVTPRRAAQ